MEGIERGARPYQRVTEELGVSNQSRFIENTGHPSEFITQHSPRIAAVSANRKSTRVACTHTRWNLHSGNQGSHPHREIQVNEPVHGKCDYGPL
jgi:hypothetical protein